MDYVVYLSKLIPRFCKKGQLVLRKGPFCNLKGTLSQLKSGFFCINIWHTLD